ncbi:MAG TPA: 5-dehydro-2-deoxygluconokinase [Vicinamibacterales bacterium]|jgi:5-dehydro-2-deoxygluconokinase|nr:5-dehydro-2-deoxygluconokinase [Vicinamibacterales bacterium]
MATALDLLCMGRSSIDLYAHEIGVPITAVKSFDAYVGGCPTNVAVGTRRLGLRSGLLTGVGTDQVGDFVLHFLQQEGVDTSAVARFHERRTSAALLTIQPPDRFPLTFYRDNCADLGLTIDHVRQSQAPRSRLLFVTGTGLSEEPSRTATLFAAETARAGGTRVIVDIDYRSGLWPSEDAFGANVRALARFAHIAIGTEEELRAATNEADIDDACARMLETGIELLVLKRGAHGARVFPAGSPAEDVEPFSITVVNVLGAGDAFASGFIYGHLQGWPAAKAARLGNATGAIVVTRHGCANFMPTIPEVREFLHLQGATDLSL